jgi:hypothetical protein
LGGKKPEIEARLKAWDIEIPARRAGVGMFQAFSLMVLSGPIPGASRRAEDVPGRWPEFR